MCIQITFQLMFKDAGIVPVPISPLIAAISVLFVR